MQNVKSRTSRKYYVDWKRNNKVALRNFHTSCDFHDVVKVLLVRMIRQKYQTSNKYPIYTEHNPEEPNDNYPDIWAKINNDIYVWEIQENVNQKWLKEITEKHESVNLIIVPLRELSHDLTELKKQLKEYVI